MSVSTRLYPVYEGLETRGAIIATELYKQGVPTLIYPEIVRPEPSRARNQTEFLREKGIVRIVIPFEPTFVRKANGTVEKESLATARERALDVVRHLAPSARKAPKEIGSPKNEAHIHLDAAEYEAVAAQLPDHLLDVA